jgi:hypothetical protein
MLKGDIIKTAGTITKEEELIAVEHNIMPNTLVLESSHPFPGYHGSNLPEDPLPGSIYLVTEVKYEGEHILRMAKRIKKHFQDKCDSSFGQAHIYAGTYNFIRIREPGLLQLHTKDTGGFFRRGHQIYEKEGC